MKRKVGSHLSGKNENGKRTITCSKCKSEIVLDVDEEAMEGMMEQLNQFTSKHLKCKGKK